jgi:hypothetical protein
LQHVIHQSARIRFNRDILKFIVTKIVNSHPAHGEVYSMKH